MAYLQESQLQKAIKRLYMLGSADPTGRQDNGPLAGALGAGIGAVRRATAKPKGLSTDTSVPPLPASLQHSDEEIAQHFQNLKDAERAQKLGEQAALVPINGVYTDQGHKQHGVDTAKALNDWENSQTLMHAARGMAGTGSSVGASVIQRGY